MKILFFSAMAWLLLSVSGHAHIETYYYLKGTIGNEEVVVAIEEYDEIEDVFLRFYKTDDLREHMLQGLVIDSAYHFTMKKDWYTVDKDTSNRIVTMVIKRNEKNKTWSGKWITLDNKQDTLQVSLEPITIKEIDNPYAHLKDVQHFDPYLYYRIAQMEFKRAGRSKQNRKVLFYKEVKSGLKFIRLARRMDADTFNQHLLFMHLKKADLSLICGSMIPDPEFSIETDITYLEDTIFSFKVHTTKRCMNGESSTFTDVFNYNIQTSEELRLDALLRFKDQEIGKQGTAGWFRYRYDIFGKEILNIMRELYPDEIAGKTGSENTPACDYNHEKPWQFPVWYFTGEGLYLGAKFPGVNKRNCNSPEWSIIPFTKLEELRRRVPAKGD